ncbi:carboxypeptidase-like regulatory domain-containing protein [Plasticicumulans acidivorans]|nr:carboxypeptidase-like regulatory domain-containing protein [Plasticicumulans acidivorans]
MSEMRAGGLAVAFASALFLLHVQEAQAMGNLCLFSALSGVVLDHGKPVEGARIERSFTWQSNGETGVDETHTDARGSFSLPVIFRRSLLASLLPHEPFIRQTILIHHAGKTYQAWMFNKGEYAENGELGGRPISLVCRLEAEPAHRDGVFGICEPQ